MLTVNAGEIMYEKEFTKIAKASRNNSLTFFVGAGVSKSSGAPMWNELIDAICNKLNIQAKDNYTYDECLKIPQMYYSSLDKKHKNEYLKMIEQTINRKELFPNIVHREMLALEPVSFVTTNYDELLESAANKYCQIFKTIACDKEVPSISGERYILKMHGDFKHKNIVLREEDYLNYSENFKLIETLLKSIFATNTVVFIGYRLNDYNIKLIMNWAKELLKNNFREPYFLYTDDEELTPLELKYHKSKGVKVLEWQKIDKNKSEFPDRYLSFFEAIKERKPFDKNNSEDALEILYDLLAPLDKLKALRYVDIASILPQDNLHIEVNGKIRVWDDNPLFKRFIEIDKMDEDKISELDKKSLHYYKVIKSTLSKAGIYSIYDTKSVHIINHTDNSFADVHCLLFDYKWMNSYVKKEYKAAESRYKQAYYLYKLGRYEDALSLFIDVARTAFNDKDYLLFYFAKANCFRLNKIVGDTNSIFRKYDIYDMEDDLPIEKQIENLFNKLPYDVKQTYESLKDIYTPVLLYKYAYDAAEAAHKVDEAIETNRQEYGVTSCDKAMSRVNDYMNFFQANCLVADIFIEYKTSVKWIMESLFHKYSVQDKCEVLIEDFLPARKERIVFDEIDFNCLVECFKDSELVSLFRKNAIKKIEFKDINVIQTAVKNLIEYFEVIKEGASFKEYINIQLKLKNALIILRYIELEQEFVEYVVSFLLSNEFRDILITDKIYFLYAQIRVQKKYSKKMAKSIESALLYYCDKHKRALDEGTDLSNIAPTTNANITYCNLADYLSAEGYEYVSRELSNRVEKMILDNQFQLYSSRYYEHLTKKTRKSLIRAINNRIKDEFDIRLFRILVNSSCRIDNDVKKQYISFLRKEVENDSEEDSGIMMYPRNRKFKNIVQAGYWHFLGIIDAPDIQEFEGIDNEFDFYYQFEKFDYEKFDVRWLLSLYKESLRKIADNRIASHQVKNCIVKSLKTNNFSKYDNDRLKDMLVEYFC